MTDDFKSKLKVLRELAKDDDLWSVITCLRGPDFPSERPNMSEAEHNKAYKARRDRKFDTVEIIRAASVGQVGGARVHEDNHVTLPPKDQWDHFDKHVARAANVLGLKVKLRKPKGTLPVAVEPLVTYKATPATPPPLPPLTPHETKTAKYAAAQSEFAGLAGAPLPPPPGPCDAIMYFPIKHKASGMKAFMTHNSDVLEWAKNPKHMPQWVHSWKYAILYVDSAHPDKAMLFTYNEATQSLQYAASLTGVLEKSWSGLNSAVAAKALAYQKEYMLALSPPKGCQ